MNSRDVISALKADGWDQVAQKGSHVQFKHPTKPGRVTVASPEAGYPARHVQEHRKAGGFEVEIAKGLQPALPAAEDAYMRQYIALIHKEANSDYGVSFPDLPGVISAGRTLDEAREMAEEALALHLEGLATDGKAVPEPSPLEDIMKDAQNRDGVAIVVAAPARDVKSVRINVTMPADVLDQIDRYAEREGFTRSGFLAQAAKKVMAG
jgi:predicted RNase H-like HicB family nuclease/predicted RNA binding protein YcfA (HicA-like mRNA interferase family)